MYDNLFLRLSPCFWERCKCLKHQNAESGLKRSILNEICKVYRSTFRFSFIQHLNSCAFPHALHRGSQQYNPFYFEIVQLSVGKCNLTEERRRMYGGEETFQLQLSWKSSYVFCFSEAVLFLVWQSHLITILRSFANNKHLYFHKEGPLVTRLAILRHQVTTVAQKVDLFWVLSFDPDITAGISKMWWVGHQKTRINIDIVCKMLSYH